MHLLYTQQINFKALNLDQLKFQIVCLAIILLKCEFLVNLNDFSNNQALIKGGAIQYDLYSPSGLLNNNFLNNQAQYGQNYASYPFKLKLLNKDIQKRFLQQSYIVSLDENFVSGQKLSSSLLIGIYDQNDQLISNDNQSETLLTSSDLTMQVSQNNKIIAQNGIFEFSDMIFVAKPSYTTQIKFITTAVNSALYSQVTGNSFQDFEVNISFRECIEGEITQNNMCIECQKGTYSLKLHSISCEKCFNNGVCYGKNITGVLPGFWRSSNESTSTFPCPNEDSCLGGIESKCKIGFEGKLCSECSKNFNGTQYARQGANDCIECESLSIQILKLLGILLLISVYVVYLLVSILNNPKRNKPQTVLIRILTNYFHAIMIVKDFDMSWPDQVQKALQIFAFVSSQSQSIFSIDCFYSNSQNLGVPIYYLKLIMTGLLPIILSSIAAIIWICVFLYKKRKNQEMNLKRNIIVSTFIFTYLCYPIITNQNFATFSCQKLDEGKSYLKTDYSIECWTGDHSSLGLVIGLTYIFFWTLGFPIFVFLMLRKNSKNLNDENVTLQYGLFFVGLNDQAYYWEIVITLTLYGGLFFVQREVQNNNNSLFVLFLAILFYNVYFLAYWLFNFSSILIRIHSKKLHRFKGLRFLSLMKLNDYESDLDQQQKLQETKLASMRGISLKFNNKGKDQLNDEFLENQNTIQKEDQSNGKEMVDSFVIDYITEAQSPQLRREKEIFPSSQPADHQPLKIEQKQKHERQLKKKQITNMIQQLQDLQLQFNNITDDNEDQEEIKTQ
eukprot:403374110